MDFEKLLKNFLDDKKRLISYPSKKKLKIISLMYLATKFEQGRIYSEKEVNYILLDWTVFGDYALLRREMYNCRFFDRKNDGSQYWLEEKQPLLSDFKLD